MKRLQTIDFKNGFKPLLFGILGVLIVDSLGSIASNKFNFDYSNLIPFTIVIYIAVGFLTTRKTNKITGIFLTTLLGLFDATVGFQISILLKANTMESDFELTSGLLIFTIIILTIFASILGWFGAWLSTKIKSI